MTVNHGLERKRANVEKRRIDGEKQPPPITLREPIAPLQKFVYNDTGEGSRDTTIQEKRMGVRVFDSGKK
jgi:hypothetical protein